MNNLSWVEIVVSILSGLAVCIPLVVKLVQTVKAAVQEKNWSQIVAIVLDLMQQAEGLFAEGAARRRGSWRACRAPPRAPISPTTM